MIETVEVERDAIIKDMIDGAGPFIKPCAFGAPQAALGLD